MGFIDLNLLNTPPDLFWLDYRAYYYYIENIIGTYFD